VQEKKNAELYVKLDGSCEGMQRNSSFLLYVNSVMEFTCPATQFIHGRRKIKHSNATVNIDFRFNPKIEAKSFGQNS